MITNQIVTVADSSRPRSAEEIRAAIADARSQVNSSIAALKEEATSTVHEWKDEASTSIRVIKDEVATTIHMVRDEVATTIDRVKDEVSTIRDHTRASFHALKEKAVHALDWREWVRRRPAAFLGAAFFLGFHLGPSRSDARELEQFRLFQRFQRGDLTMSHSSENVFRDASSTARDAGNSVKEAAGTLRAGAERIGSQVASAVTSYSHDAASAIKDGAETVSEYASSFGTEVTKFVKARPGTVLIAAIAAGFLIGRLVSRR